jgi:hypothetical protein
MTDFPAHYFPENWRSIIHETDKSSVSSSENVSPKGAMFQEDPCTAPPPEKHPRSFHQPLEITVLSGLAIREKIPTRYQGLYNASQN